MLKRKKVKINYSVCPSDFLIPESNIFCITKKKVIYLKLIKSKKKQ